MSQTYSSTGNNLKLLPSSTTLPEVTAYDFTEIAYTVFAYTSALLLIGLALRIIFALLVVTNAFTRGITIFTDPFVLPFTRFFNDAHTMVQVSTGAAFTAYYLLYWIISLSSRLIRRPRVIKSFAS